MVIAGIQGGLGNQMFQYALGKVISEINKTTLKLYIHGLYIPVEGHLSRDYMLEAFNLKADIADDSILKTINKGNILHKLSLKKIKHYKQLVFDEKNPEKTHFKDARFLLKPEITTFYPELLEKDNTDIYLDGYWQSYKYFIGYEELIRQQFVIKNDYLKYAPEYFDLINSSQSVSIHLRLTDRVSTDFGLSHYRYLDWDYYEKAIEIIKERIPFPHFFIFSDNIEWCKEKIKLDFPVTYVKAQDEYNDMYLMGMCKHHIIAHSTFSWWAVWLQFNASKVVVAPQKWFNRQPDNLEDLLLKEWIKI